MYDYTYDNNSNTCVISCIVILIMLAIIIATVISYMLLSSGPSARTWTRQHWSPTGMYVCMHVCMYVCMYVYVCIYIYIYMEVVVTRRPMVILEGRTLEGPGRPRIVQILGWLWDGCPVRFGCFSVLPFHRFGIWLVL